MRVVDFVRPELVVAELSARTKPELIAELAGRMAEHVDGVDGEALTRVLSERERLASTAIGEGIAIPHGRLSTVGALHGMVARSRSGVDFESLDGQPTQLFFVLVAPEGGSGMHLKALARVSRLLKDPDVRARLLEAKDAGSMYRMIAEEDSRI